MVRKIKQENEFVDSREERRARWNEWRRERQKSNPSRMGALFLICLGVLFLLSNTGVIPWSIWRFIIPYWPLLLVLAGIRVIMGRSRGANLVVGILSILLFGAVVANALKEVQSPLFTKLQLDKLPIYSYFNQLHINRFYE